MFRDLADLRPAALEAALVGAGAATGTLTEARAEPVEDGAGFLSTLARVHLVWDGEGPSSVVAKLPASIPANQEIVDRFGYDRREAGVYRELRPWERAPAPRVLAQHWDDTAGRGWLLLEDLGDHHAGDSIVGATDSEAIAVAHTLARWHAAYWNDPTLVDHAWLPAVTDPVVAGYGQIFDITWSMCVDKLGDLAPDVADAAVEGRTWFDVAVDEFSRGDRTVVHGDARLDNFRFGPDGAVALDFQLAALGRGVYDLAFFCAGSLTTEDRRRLEPDLLDEYGDTLDGLGIAVEKDRLWRDYRLGHMLNLPNPVSAIAVVTPADERGAEFLRRNAIRGLTAVADHVALLG
ncbi:MAG: aminoglycoside phosphotransferase [Acidimicrobiales bacterium]|nr:MAG: aminoglycoside phosphotransferase [Acidimicrobiales bacterium]